MPCRLEVWIRLVRPVWWAWWGRRVRGARCARDVPLVFLLAVGGWLGVAVLGRWFPSGAWLVSIPSRLWVWVRLARPVWRVWRARRVRDVLAVPLVYRLAVEWWLGVAVLGR